MATPEQLAALAARGRKSVEYYRSGTVSDLPANHRARLDSLSLQGRQSLGGGSAPSAPAGLATTVLSASSIRLAWSDVSGETEYQVFRSLTNNSGTATQIGTVGANVVTYTDVGLAASTPYYYWLKAANSAGASAFSSVATGTTLASGGGSNPLGTYLGFFRFNRGSYSPKMFSREPLICQGSTAGKFVYAVSGASMSNEGAGTGTGGYLTELNMPSIGSLSPSHAISEAPQVAAPTGWVDVLTGYAAECTALGLSVGSGSSGIRIGGIAKTADGKLWVNCAKAYHTGSDIYPSIAEHDPTTLAKVGTRYRATGTSADDLGGEWSGPNGRLLATEGTALSAYGEFLCTCFWLVNSYGPRWQVQDLGASFVSTISEVLRHPSGTPQEIASVKFDIGGGVFVGSNFVFPVRNGVDGWYGNPDGTHTGASTFYATARNWLSDPWDTGKGYHAHPYNAALWSVPVSEMAEVLAGTRSPDACTYTITDVTDLMQLKITNGTYIYGDGSPVPPSPGTSFQADSYAARVGAQLAKVDGYYLLIEQNVETVGSQQQHIVHVWSGDN